MKNLILFGSPHREGTTALLLQRFLEKWNRVSPGEHEFIWFDAYQEAVAPCIGCGVCDKINGCRYSDCDRLDEAYRTCDVMIIASPIYNLGVPSPLKAVFDRTQRYFAARFVRGEKPPIAKHKKAVMLLTCGSNDPAGVEMIRKQLKMIFTILNTELVGEAVWDHTDQNRNPSKADEMMEGFVEKLARERVLW